jgi:hypothetical protein
MVNTLGKKEDLKSYYDNGQIAYNFRVDSDGYCSEFIYDFGGRVLSFKNSDGLTEVPKKEIELTKNDYFEKVVTDTLSEVKELLIVKGKEYRRNDNVYHNFDQGAKIKGITPEKVLDGFLLKHEISIADMTNDLDKGIMPSREKVEEKFNDNIIYLLIKKAMILNRLK